MNVAEVAYFDAQRAGRRYGMWRVEARVVGERLRALRTRFDGKDWTANAIMSPQAGMQLAAILDYARLVTVEVIARRPGGVRCAAVWRYARYALGDANAGEMYAAVRQAIIVDSRREELTYIDYELLLPAIQLRLLLVLERCFRLKLPTRMAIERLLTVSSLSGEQVIGLALPFEDCLRADPANVYARLDAYSRHVYRKAVFDLAKSCQCAPSRVAETAIGLASQAVDLRSSNEDAAAHIGYYLVDDGRARLREVLTGERQIATKLPVRARIGLTVAAKAAVASIAASVAAGAYEVASLPEPLEFVVNVAIIMLAYEYFGTVVRRLSGWITGQRRLATIEYNGQLPWSCRTIIAVPCLLVDDNQIDAMLEAQFWNFVVANDTNVSVALLTDFPDSVNGVDSDDERRLLAYCASRVELFNRRYSCFDKVPLTILHRPRRYSATQRAWIGEERKRGKLQELHRFIKSDSSSVDCVVGNPDELRGARFVLCVDEDTRLSRGALHTMVGVLGHPLNRAVIDPVRRRVVRGHGLVVPVLRTRATDVKHWRLGGIATGQRFDERAAPVEMREFYHDCFGATHYPGKGLYEVAVYEQVCAGRIPDERILSHDTIEGAWLRPGYVGRAALVEGFPSTHSRLRARQLRWIIGDWQNLWFVLSCVCRRREVPAMLWYIVLNQVRASLTAVIIALLALVAITGSPELSNRRILTVMLILFGPIILRIVVSCVTEPMQWLRVERWSDAGALVKRGALEVFFRLVSSLDDAAQTLRAIITSAWRWVRGKDLLAWRAAALVEADVQASETHLVGFSLATLGSALLLVWLISTGRASLAALVLLSGWSATGWLFNWLAPTPKSKQSASSPVSE